MICPCQQCQKTPKNYTDCCQPYHNGKAASNSEALMRSRYSAFFLGLTGYVKKSWHPSTRPHDLALEPDANWLKLDIISSAKKQVHFQAFFKNDDGSFSVLDETSDFVFENNNWLYVEGDTDIRAFKPQRNALCLCGSGKKYKACCM